MLIYVHTLGLQGILNAVEKWAPEAEHRNCARHIYANWKRHFHDKKFQKKFWKCAKAPCRMLFNLARAKLAQVTQAGAQAILNTHPEHWSRAWFRLGFNCDSVDNNLCESFNKWILESRFYPIITMLETIRRKVIVRISDQKTNGARWTTVICPGILQKLNVYINESTFCHAICNGGDSFEVKHHEHRFTVHLDKKECSCRYWQLSGLPCPHAISCIFYRTNKLDDYIVECYSVEAFRSTYDHYLQPLEGMSAWPQDDREPLNAPGYIKMPDWPKTARRREMHEPPKPTKMSRFGSVMRCTRCHQVGHNKSSCAKNNAPAAGTSSAQPMETQSQQMVLSNTPGSSAQSKKRKATTVTTTSTTIQSRSKKSKNKVCAILVPILNSLVITTN